MCCYVSPLQDPHRLHYEPSELKVFENIECEWPLFFELLLLDALIRGDTPAIKSYREKLESVVIRDGSEGLVTVPELYQVPEDKVREGEEREGEKEWLTMVAGVVGVPEATQSGQSPWTQEAAHVVSESLYSVWSAGGGAAQYWRDRPSQSQTFHGCPARPSRPE